MEELGFGPNDDSVTCDQKQKNCQELRILSIKRCTEDLVHASQCKGPNCSLPNCQKIRRVVQHAKSCKQKTNGGCLICKQLIVLRCYHAKQCQEPKCLVPFCVNIKYKLRQQRLQNRLQEARKLKRRLLISGKNSGFCSVSHQNSPGSLNSSSESFPSSEPHSSSNSPQPGVRVEPSIETPVPAVQVVQEVQASATTQTPPHMVSATVNYIKGNPAVSPSTANTGTECQLKEEKCPVLSCVDIKYKLSRQQIEHKLQKVPIFESSSHIIQIRDVTVAASHISPGNSDTSSHTCPGNSFAGPPQVTPTPGPSLGGMQKLPWQKLIQALKSPQSAEQEQQVLAILKSNPKLIASLKSLPSTEEKQNVLAILKSNPQLLVTFLKSTVQPRILAWKQLLQVPISKSNKQITAAFIMQKQKQQQEERYREFLKLPEKLRLEKNTQICVPVRVGLNVQQIQFNPYCCRKKQLN